GPTGSGKTTSLNAMLRRIQSDSLKIITIEDPVEFVLDGIDQIQVNEAIGLGFDSLLRRVLRQDPNVVMVGEVRDASTAELVIRAALTGHLVLTTLHTNDSISVISRLRNIGVEPFLIAAVLRGVVAQRLVRCLCPLCSVPDKPKPAELALALNHGVELTTLRRAGGCPACAQSGYKGRSALYEHFLLDERLEEMIVRNARTAELRDYLIQAGMKTLARVGLERVAAGVTTIEEIEREVEL
ncbi:MAG TPA: type II/IV secretion system protein, partial [Spirochaetaceae bacterium]|nr:type II/IV secretion system protein [Spirochaetaceae bacterium]